MNEKQNKHLAAIMAAHTTLATFLKSVRVPESFNVCACSMSNGDAVLSAYCWDSDRDEILNDAAEAFSPEGWIESEGANKGTMNWKKKLGDVELRIVNANVLPPVVERPVKPAEFPALLKSTSESQ